MTSTTVLLIVVFLFLITTLILDTPLPKEEEREPLPTLPSEAPTIASTVDTTTSPPTATAIIVETRSLHSLLFAVWHMLKVLPSPQWVVVLVHAPENRKFVCSAFSANPRVQLVELAQRFTIQTTDCLATEPTSLQDSWPSGWGLANIQLTHPFMEAIPTENYLTFQTDGLLCDGDPLDIHERLMSMFVYDFVGAPWGYTQLGGNGGFSLRKKSATLKVLSQLLDLSTDTPYLFDTRASPTFTKRHEDAIFIDLLSSFPGLSLPSYETAMAFSTETNFTIGSKSSLGFHNPWKHLSLPQYESFKQACPVVAVCHQLSMLNGPRPPNPWEVGTGDAGTARKRWERW